MNDAVKVIIGDGQGKLLLQFRDVRGQHVVNKATLTCFGGIINENETPLAAAVREIREEISLRLKLSQLTFIGTYPMKSRPAQTHVYAADDVNIFKIKDINEGAGYIVAAYKDIVAAKLPVSPDAQEYLKNYALNYVAAT